MWSAPNRIRGKNATKAPPPIHYNHDKILDADSWNPPLKIQPLTKIHMLMAENHLCDIFRVRYPEKQRFTCWWKDPFNQRRLDYYLISDCRRDYVKYQVQQFSLKISKEKAKRIGLESRINPIQARDPPLKIFIHNSQSFRANSLQFGDFF